MAVDGLEDLIAAPAQKSRARVMAELFGIVSTTGIAENFGAVGVGDDGFEMEVYPSG